MVMILKMTKMVIVEARDSVDHLKLEAIIEMEIDQAAGMITTHKVTHQLLRT
jgi:hypothetical protein